MSGVQAGRAARSGLSRSSSAATAAVQATVGCAHNSCTFCSMYKEDRFAIRPLEDILRDLEEGSRLYPWKKVFLADGDALVMKTKDILTILKYIYDHFPAVEQVTSYGILIKNWMGVKNNEKRISNCYRCSCNLYDCC